MENLIIRQALPEDAPAIMELIIHLAEFEKMPHGPEINAKILEEDLRREAVLVKVAFHGTNCIGYVLHSHFPVLLY